MTLLLEGVGGSATGAYSSGPGQAERVLPPPVSVPAGASALPAAATPLTASGAPAVSEPVRLLVPAIALDAPVDPLTLDDDGALAVPERPERLGWWSGGSVPGAPGPAVIVGHVDDASGPAVFHDVPALVAGDRVVVEGADGDVHAFVVDRVEQHAKEAFPTAQVYGATQTPELRLITCGGRFDRDQRSYQDNVVVFARLAQP